MKYFICRSVEQLNQALSQCDRVILGYIRVSSDLVHQDTSVERQIKDLIDAGSNIVLVERESGTNIQRRRLYVHMLDLIDHSIPELILGIDNRRFNRNLVEMNFFYNSCLDKDIPWKLIYEPELNSDSPYSENLRWERAVKAQEESRNIGFRVQKHYLRAEIDIKVSSRTPVFGYRINKQKKYEIDYALPDLSNVIGFYQDKAYARGELAFKRIELFFKFRTTHQTFKQYKHFLEQLKIHNQKLFNNQYNASYNSFLEWLKDPTIRGHQVYGKYCIKYKGTKKETKTYRKAPRSQWRIYSNQHESFLTFIQEKQLDKLLEKNKNKAFAASKTKHNKPETFSSILRCKHCLLGYIAHNNGLGYTTYYCRGRWEYKNCKASGITQIQLTKKLISEIINQSGKLAQLLDNSLSGILPPDADKLNQLKQSLKVVHQQHLLTGSELFLDTSRKLQQEIAELESRTKKEISTLKDRQDLIKGLSDPEFWQSLDRQDLHRYLNDVVKLAWLDNKAIYRLDLDL